MNDWGLPDWHDPLAYGDTKGWTFMRWRWEFYRRRDDLRAFFDANAQRTYQETCAVRPPWPDGSMGRVLRPDEPRFVAKGWHHEVAPFGYTGIPNPRIPEQPSDVIFSVLDYPGDTRMIMGAGLRQPNAKALPIDIGDGEMAVIFDLDKPLGPQFERLPDELAARQIMRHGKALQKRRHPAKWLSYLQVLDAREAGASWAEISAILPRTAGTEQTARDTWEQASALRFNF